MTIQILRLPAVKARTGLSRSTIYARTSEGTFPYPISLGKHAVGWIDEEIENWLTEQMRKSRDSESLVTATETPAELATGSSE